MLQISEAGLLLVALAVGTYAAETEQEPAAPNPAVAASSPSGRQAQQILILTDSPDSPFVRSLRTLCPQRVDAFDLKTIASGKMTGDGVIPAFLVSEVRDDRHLADVPLKFIREFAAGGGTCVLGLDEFAQLHGWKVQVQTLANCNYIPELKPEQWQGLIKAAALINGNETSLSRGF